MRAVRTSAALAVAALVGIGLSACGGSGEEPSNTPPATLRWSPKAGATGLVSGPAPTGAQGRHTASTSDIWHFDLPEPHDPNVPSSQWPSVTEVISKAQLKAAFPDATEVSSSHALKLHYNGDSDDPGPATAKNSQITWNISLEGATGGPSTLTIDIRAIGADSKLTEAWTKDRDSRQQNGISTDTFYERGTYGAKGLYLLQNNRASVLISDGDMAAWIELSFGAFYGLAVNPTDARGVLKTQVFPVIVQDIASHMPRRYA